jgi:hypothetical protein
MNENFVLVPSEPNWHDEWLTIYDAGEISKQTFIENGFDCFGI